ASRRCPMRRPRRCCPAWTRRPAGRTTRAALELRALVMNGAELLRLIAAQVCLHATMAGMRLATPLLALQQGHSAAAVGVLIALFALTQVFLALPAGRFADRHGFKRPLRLSVVAAVAGPAMAVAWPHFGVLCVAALLTGGATGATVIALQRHVG